MQLPLSCRQTKLLSGERNDSHHLHFASTDPILCLDSNCLEKGNDMWLVFLDILKIFDKVYYTDLIFKMRQLGIC